MIIFPLMQRNVKKRTDEIRNNAVVRDLTKLKTAVENYLKRKPTFGKKLIEVDKATLVENGLPVGFNMTNVLGQEYSVRIKVSEDSKGAPIYEAIVLASGVGTDIPPLRIRDIVKDIKGYAGYVEGGMIYGPDWQLSTAGWGRGLNESSIVMRTGSTQKEYQYVARKPGFGTAKMQADLYMSSHDIESVNGLYIGGGAEFVDAKFGTSGDKSDVDNFSVTKELRLEGNMTIGADLNFPNGLDLKEDNFVNNDVPVVYLEDTLDVGGNFVLSQLNAVNKLRSLTANTLDGAAMNVANSLVFDGNDGVLALQNLIANSMTVNKNETEQGIIFSRIKSNSNSDVSISGNAVNIYDVVVRDVNSALIAAGYRKVGGIDITEGTPLSVILRGIFYQYQDIYKLVYNDYDNTILPGWYPNLYLRCEYSYCQGKWYY